MNGSGGQSVTARVNAADHEVTIRLQGASEAEFLGRFARLAGYLAILSDREFREVGEAVRGALPTPGSNGRSGRPKSQSIGRP